MYASTLRNSPVWCSQIQALASPTALNLRESHLTPHDLSVPIPTPTSTSTPSTQAPTRPKAAAAPNAGSGLKRTLCAILLTPSSLPSTPNHPIPPSTHADTDAETLLNRLGHLTSLTGGRDVALVLLLSDPPHRAQGNAHGHPSGQNPDQDQPCQQAPTTQAVYHALQVLLASHRLRIPILPLCHPDGLVPLLARYVQGLARHSHVNNLATSHHPGVSAAVASTAASAAAQRKVVTTLLPLCTADPPLSEHDILQLTDVAGSIGELARLATGGEEEGRARIVGGLEEGMGEGFVEFWGFEFVREV